MFPARRAYLVAILGLAGVAVALVSGTRGGGQGAVATVGPKRVSTASRTTPAPVAKRRPPVLTLPRNSFPVVFVKRGERVRIWNAPAGGHLVRLVGARTPFGSRTTMAVARTSGPWAGVITPYLPNNELGWVRLDPRRLGAYGSDYSIDVDLSQRRAIILRSGHAIRAFPVTVGAPGSDTPTGHFAVTDTFRGNLNPAYGCCAAALSAHQPNLPSGWFGGSRIAIHGTYEALGLALSHGCIRAANDDVSMIVSTVPIGSPVDVHQ